MLQLLKETPDWALGLGAGIMAWYGISYSVLAERALERDMKELAAPACLSQLKADQEKVRAQAAKREAAGFSGRRNNALSALRAELGELNALSMKLELVEQASGVIKGSPFSDILQLYAPLAGIPSADDLHERRMQIESAIEQWKTVSVSLDFPEVPTRELQATCACTIAQAVAGEKTSYAISLASFRIIAPTEISQVKRNVSNILNVSGCGKQPWEQYRHE